MEALCDCLGVAVVVAAGYRAFGRSFWQQFSIALPVATAFFSISAAYESGFRPAFWQLASFSAISAVGMFALYQLDKRFKLTRWEKEPD
jgi:hypothetical protein